MENFRKRQYSLSNETKNNGNFTAAQKIPSDPLVSQILEVTTQQLWINLMVLSPSQRNRLLDEITNQIDVIKQHLYVFEDAWKKEPTAMEILKETEQDKRSDKGSTKISSPKKTNGVQNPVVLHPTFYETVKQKEIKPPLILNAASTSGIDSRCSSKASSIPLNANDTLTGKASLEVEKQYILKVIHEAHGGKAPQEKINDYLKGPFVLLKENGEVTAYQNPFFKEAAFAHLKKINPNFDPSAPEPPVLLPQTQIPLKKDRKESENGGETKGTPPPKLAPQLENSDEIYEASRSPLLKVRNCNKWSVVTVALPSRLTFPPC